MQKRVLVLGGTGMLGSMVADVLARDPRLDVVATGRPSSEPKAIEGIKWIEFAERAALDVLHGYDWIVNCIGVIKPFIDDHDPAAVKNAIRVNGLLPHRLASATRDRANVIQIATDCVYSGATGRYVENDPHDPLDAYGKTKSLGEVTIPNFHHIRCSIIGPEAGRSRSLLEWFLGQRERARLSGFINHRWNGVTTLHFAKICIGIVTGAVTPRLRQHLVPSGEVTKHELLSLFADAYGREDLTIDPVEAATAVDRTLATDDDGANRALWSAAGYASPPTIAEMVTELGSFDYRFRSVPADPAAD